MSMQHDPSATPGTTAETSAGTHDDSRPGGRGRGRMGLIGAIAAAGALVAGVAVASAGPSTTSTGRAASALPAGPVVAAAAPTPGSAEAFVAVTPVRVLDTRGAPNGPVGVTKVAPMTAGQQIDLTLAGAGKAIPAGATAAVLNIAIDQDATLQSYLTIWPQGEAKPFTAANNAVPGQVAANFTMAKLGTTGGISLFNQQGNVNVVIDLVGYTVPLSSVTAPNAAISAWGTFATPTNVATDAPVAFAQAGPLVGTGVVQTDADTFTVQTAGVYQIDYRLTSSASSPLGSVQVEVAGVPTGPANALAAVNGVLTDTVLVTAQAGDTLELVVETTGLQLATGSSSRIAISLVEPAAPTTTTTTTTPSSSTTSTTVPASTSSTSSTTTTVI